jgi:UTP--glucose-1-phosphate uridylyltransferase
MGKIKKAVIPVAGFGTRLLPATKAQPKEMLRIVDKPAVQYVVEEAVQSGIQDILLVTGRNKRAIEDYFDYAVELERELEEKGKTELLNVVRNVSEMVSIYYVRQKVARGLGDAIYHAKGFVSDSPFGVLLADDIIDSEVPVLKQMIDVYERHPGVILAVMEVPMQNTKLYGIIEGKKIGDRLYDVKNLVEKPDPMEAPSNIAIVGRYILTPSIFESLEKTAPGKNGEVQITDAIRNVGHKEKIYAYKFEGTRFDVGEKLGYLKANVAFALKNKKLGEEFRKYLKSILWEDKE